MYKVSKESRGGMESVCAAPPLDPGLTSIGLNFLSVPRNPRETRDRTFFVFFFFLSFFVFYH